MMKLCTKVSGTGNSRRKKKGKCSDLGTKELKGGDKMWCNR